MLKYPIHKHVSKIVTLCKYKGFSFEKRKIIVYIKVSTLKNILQN